MSSTGCIAASPCRRVSASARLGCVTRPVTLSPRRPVHARIPASPCRRVSASVLAPQNPPPTTHGPWAHGPATHNPSPASPGSLIKPSLWIVGVERRRDRAGAALQKGIDRRQHNQRGKGRRNQAADHGAAQRRRLFGRLRRTPAPSEACPRSSPTAVIRIARRRPRAAFERGVEARTPRRAGCISAKVTSRIEFATAMPIAMIAPMNDCTFSVVPGDQQHQQHAAEHGGNRSSTMASASRSDWKFAASSRKIDRDGEQQADAQAGDASAPAAESGREHSTVTPRGGAPARAIAAAGSQPASLAQRDRRECWR